MYSLDPFCLSVHCVHGRLGFSGLKGGVLRMVTSGAAVRQAIAVSEGVDLSQLLAVSDEVLFSLYDVPVQELFPTRLAAVELVALRIHGLDRRLRNRLKCLDDRVRKSDYDHLVSQFAEVYGEHVVSRVASLFSEYVSYRTGHTFLEWSYRCAALAYLFDGWAGAHENPVFVRQASRFRFLASRVWVNIPRSGDPVLPDRMWWPRHR